MPGYPLFDIYALDDFGSRVRIGLTLAETSEFEALNADEPPAADGQLPSLFSQNAAVRERERRWFELYRRHEAARYAMIEKQRPYMTLSKVFATRL